MRVRSGVTFWLGKSHRIRREIMKKIWKEHTRPPAERDSAYWIDYYCGILGGLGLPTDFEREPDREFDLAPPTRESVPKRRGSKRSF